MDKAGCSQFVIETKLIKYLSNSSIIQPVMTSVICKKCEKELDVISSVLCKDLTGNCYDRFCKENYEKENEYKNKEGKSKC